MALAGLAAHAQVNDSVAVPGQRVITPVKPATNTTLTPPKGTDEKVIQRYLSGDTVSALEEARKDSLSRIYPRYPVATELIIGLNVGDMVARLLGQKYGGIDASVTLNMWNRLQPVAEFGIGWTKETPEAAHYTYRTPPAPYLKLGADYNFLFKKTPKYQLFAGVRLGATFFKYDITDVEISSPYWQQSQTGLQAKGNNSSAIWGEILAGLRVQLWKNFAMGWQLRWHTPFAIKKSDIGKPWYIPGMGDRERHWQLSINFHYTLPLNRHLWPVENNATVTTTAAPTEPLSPRSTRAD